MIELTPELQAAAAPLATPVVPTPSVPTVAAPFQTNNPVAPAGPVAPLGTSTSAPAPAAAQPAAPARPKNPTFAEKLHAAIIRSPLNYLNPLATVAVSAVDALAGPLSRVAAPEDSGMAVLSQTAQNIEAQKAAKAKAVAAAQQQVAAAKQKAFENQIKAQNAATDKQKADAAMMDAHAKFITSMRLDNDSSGPHNTAMAKNAEAQVKPILDSGGEILYPSVTEDQLHSQDFLDTLPQDPKHGGPDYTQFMPVFTGTTAVLNPDGTPEINPKNGEPVFTRNFEVVKLGKPVTLGQQQADFLNRYNPSGQQYQVGQVLPAQLYTREYAAAHVLQGAELIRDKTVAEARKDMTQAQKNRADAVLANQTAAQKQQNMLADKLFAPYLAQAGGDAVLGIDMMRRSKDAKSISLVEQRYGAGVIEKTRQDNLVALQKTIADGEKQLNDPTTSATMNDQDKFDLQNEVQNARAERNQYLGLHRNDPPIIGDSILKLNKVPADQRSAQILLSKNTPDNAKRYLLQHYGLPVPTNLQVPAAVPAAPPAQQ